MEIKFVESKPGYSGIQGVCPFVDWALGAGRSGFFPSDATLPPELEEQRRMPVMLRLKGITPEEFAAGHRFFSSAADVARWRSEVRIPALYTHGNMRGRPRIVCTALVTRWFFNELARNANLLAAVARVTLGLPLREESMPALPSAKPTGALP